MNLSRNTNLINKTKKTGLKSIKPRDQKRLDAIGSKKVVRRKKCDHIIVYKTENPVALSRKMPKPRYIEVNSYSNEQACIDLGLGCFLSDTLDSVCKETVLGNPITTAPQLCEYQEIPVHTSDSSLVIFGDEYLPLTEVQRGLDSIESALPLLTNDEIGYSLSFMKSLKFVSQEHSVTEDLRDKLADMLLLREEELISRALEKGTPRENAATSLGYRKSLSSNLIRRGLDPGLRFDPNTEKSIMTVKPINGIYFQESPVWSVNPDYCKPKHRSLLNRTFRLLNHLITHGVAVHPHWRTRYGPRFLEDLRTKGKFYSPYSSKWIPVDTYCLHFIPKAQKHFIHWCNPSLEAQGNYDVPLAMGGSLAWYTIASISGNSTFLPSLAMAGTTAAALCTQYLDSKIRITYHKKFQSLVNTGKDFVSSCYTQMKRLFDDSLTFLANAFGIGEQGLEYLRYVVLACIGLSLYKMSQFSSMMSSILRKILSAMKSLASYFIPVSFSEPSTDGSMEAQGATTLVPTSICMCLLPLITKESPLSGLRSLRNVSMAWESLDSTFSVEKSFKDLTDRILVWFDKDPYFSVEPIYSSMIEWIDEAELLLSSPTLKDDIMVNIEDFDNLATLVKRAHDLDHSLRPYRDIPADYRTRFTKAKIKLQDLKTKAERERLKTENLYQANWLYLLGEPGVAKTRTITAITRIAYAKAYGKVPETKDIFVKPQTSKYWDGYTCQKIIFIDDIWQMKNAEMNAAMTQDCMNIADSSIKVLDMADCPSKNGTVCMAKFLCTTGNSDINDANHGATKPNAVRRRITFPLFMRNLHKEYFDLSKKVTIEQFDAKYSFELTPDARKNLSKYTGIFAPLLNEYKESIKADPTAPKLWTVSEIITHMANSVKETDGLPTIAERMIESFTDESMTSQGELDSCECEDVCNGMCPQMVTIYSKMEEDPDYAYENVDFDTDTTDGALKAFKLFSAPGPIVIAAFENDSTIGTARTCGFIHAGILVYDDQGRVLTLESGGGKVFTGESDEGDNLVTSLYEATQHKKEIADIIRDGHLTCMEFAIAVMKVVGCDYRPVLKAENPVFCLTSYTPRGRTDCIRAPTLHKYLPHDKKDIIRTPASNRFMSSVFMANGKAVDPLRFYGDIPDVTLPSRDDSNGQTCHILYNGRFLTRSYNKSTRAAITKGTTRIWYYYEEAYYLIDFDGTISRMFPPRGRIDRWTSKARHYASKAYGYYYKVKDNNDYKTIALVMTAALAGCAVAYALCNKLTSSAVESLTGQTMYNKPFIENSPLIPQNSHAGDSYAKVFANIRKIRIIKGGIPSQSHALFIDGYTAVVTKHDICGGIGAIDSISIINDGDSASRRIVSDYTIKESQIHTETAYLSFKKPVQSISSIRHLIPEELSQNYDSVVRLHRHVGQSSVSSHVTQRLPIARIDKLHSLKYMDENGTEKKRMITGYYQFPDDSTKKGDCGLPYMVLSKGTWMLGFIHFAALGDNSYATGLTKGDLPPFPEKGAVYSNPLESLMTGPSMDGQNMTLVNGLRHCGQLKVGLSIPKFNNIKASPLVSNEISPYNSDTEGLPPIEVGKACMHIPEIVEKADRFFHGSYDRDIPRMMEYEKADKLIYLRGLDDPHGKIHSFLRIDQAIHGDPHIGLDSLDSSTSIGPLIKLKAYPSLANVTSRHDLWNHDTKWINPELRKIVAQRVVDMSQGKFTNRVCFQFYKEETRDLCKHVVVNKPDGGSVDGIVPRIVFAGCVIDLIVDRMYFGTMLSKMKKHFSSSNEMVGINMYNFGSKVLFDKINKHPNYFADDVKACDMTFCPKSLERVITFIEWWYQGCSDRDASIRRGLLRSYLSVMHVRGKDVYIGWCNISGALLTCLINAVHIYSHSSECFYFCRDSLFCTIDTRNSKMRQYAESIKNLRFEDEVEMPTFGDDSITSVSDLAAPFFNRKVKHEYLKARGIITTMPDKSQTMTEFCKEGEAEMLQRTFYPVPGDNIVYARLNESSILNSLYFTSSTVSKMNKQERIEVIGQILESAGREYYMYGEEKFMWFVDSFKERYENIGGIWPVPDYRTHDLKFRNSYFNSNYAFGNWDF